MRAIGLAALLLALLLAGCAGDGGSAAPEILYGEDVCDRCRMVISERRHAAAARLDGRDHRFDDPGCLVGFLQEVGGTGRPLAWVHDESGAWLAVDDAWLVVDPEGGTPMASGILAFGSAEAAAAAGEAFGSEPRRWPVIVGAAEEPGR